MAAFYVRRIEKGLMSLDEVPARWQEEVSALLAQ